MHAEGKRALYNSSGRSAVYAAQRRGATSAGATSSSYYSSGFRPRARSGWSNFRYQQRTYARHSARCIRPCPSRARLPAECHWRVSLFLLLQCLQCDMQVACKLHMHLAPSRLSAGYASLQWNFGYAVAITPLAKQNWCACRQAQFSAPSMYSEGSAAA